jgi:hypothetical protein
VEEQFQDHDPRGASNHMGWIQEGFLKSILAP